MPERKPQIASNVFPNFFREKLVIFKSAQS